ncbi:MAG: FAD:protein FMN transferase [Planctomycetes bacterium]|nr:FAD:protein FMN transferase [Planctomycetota bacterium]
MTTPEEHSRRDFLRGRAAVRVVAGKAQAWVDSASELLGVNIAPGSVAHVHASRRAMACEFAVQYHEADGEMQEEVLAAFDLIEQVEDQLTIYRDHSEVIDINQRAAQGPVEVDSELYGLLQLCQQLNRDTAGAFDITSGPLSRTWGFLQRAGRLPDASEIEVALALVGAENVDLDAESQTVRFRKLGIEINFNSIGKGYALDRAAMLLDEANHTDYLWHGGGSSVLARGENRGSREACWTIGLRHPLQPERRLAEFHLRDRALATAGGATQFFEESLDGKCRQFSHILDPRSGWPATEVLTATVLAPTAALADGLATAFFVLGVESTKQYCSRHPEIGAVLVCPAEKAQGIAVNTIGLHENEWTHLPSTADC